MQFLFYLNEKLYSVDQGLCNGTYDDIHQIGIKDILCLIGFVLWIIYFSVFFFEILFDDDSSKPELFYPLVFFLFYPLVLLGIHHLVRFHVKFVTRGDKSINPLYGITVPEERRIDAEIKALRESKKEGKSRPSVVGRHFIYSNNTYKSYLTEHQFSVGSWILGVSAINGWVFLAIILFHKFPVTLSFILLPVLLYVFILLLARKVYDLSRKIKEHINDPNAHHSPTDQDT